MWRLIALGVVSVAAPASAAPGPKEPAGRGPIVGSWRLETIDGRPPVVPEVETFGPDGTRVVRARIDGREDVDKSGYVTRPKASPAELDFVFGPKTEPIQGIYKVEGDTLTICYRRSGAGGRPTEFKHVGNDIALCVYKRVKPD